MPKTLRSIGLTQVTEWDDGVSRRVEDYLAGEEPLEMRVGRRSIGVTLRTPGHDAELAAGFLYTEGVITDREQLQSIDAPDTGAAVAGVARNIVRINLSKGVKIPSQLFSRRFSAGSACGICGKEAISQIRQHGVKQPNPDFRFDPKLLCELPERLRAAQPIFGRTGGLHAAALFNAHGELRVIREDIGRHNAVDKVIGWALLQNQVPLASHVLLVSGRGGFEIVQKALMAGVSLLASVSAPSSLAVQLARELGLTLVGFLRGRRFVIYAGEERLGISERRRDAANARGVHA